MTKLFYFMRRSRVEGHFGFFLEPILSLSDQSDISIFEKLCSCTFYIDELSEFYSKYLKHYIIVYSTSHYPSFELKKCIKSGFNVINFSSALELFETLDDLSVAKILDIWLIEGNIPPQHVFESALAYSFPSTIFLDAAEKHGLRFKFSSELSNMLQEKVASNLFFNSERWSKIVGLVSLDEPSGNIVESAPKDIIVNLMSNLPTDKAYGLFEIRKLVQSDTNFVLNINLIQSSIDCLFNDDRYFSTHCLLKLNI